MFQVVCGFNGTIYSKHTSRENAERAAEKMRRCLAAKRHLTGSLCGYVEVVPEGSSFTNIVPADNDFGCVAVSQKRWVAPSANFHT